MNNSGIINVFQKDLERGSEVSAWAKKMGYGSNKRYFYVETPEYEKNKKDGFRLFMRACCFIHLKGDRNPSRFVVVKSTDMPGGSKSWEPPKGQTEGKDGLQDKSKPLLNVLQDNLLREIYEEAKITDVTNMKHTGLVLQSREDEYPENTFFQYHVFQAFITEEEFKKAEEKFAWYKEHPKAWSRLRKDNREKDEIGWFNPSKTKLYGKWSPSIVAMYLNSF